MHTFEYELTRKTNPSTLKHGNQMISANDRMHFRVKSQLTQFLRKLSGGRKWGRPVYTKRNPCTITVDIQPPTSRRMDAPNWYPTIKALIDGLVDGGLLSDDNNHVIKSTTFKSTKLSDTKNYKLIITIEPMEKGNDDAEFIL